MPLSNKTLNHKLYYLLGSKVGLCPNHAIVYWGRQTY